ncbi:hypothetical protein [Rossellomorea vietnamensis]|uniref:hypothetical protein n=1 Tax=Rossellomorea vietnamensis TaxID=218284 RepID=UPI001CCE96CD|nr:hypothetical protein [Rossellomorea vietnamensis]MCA0151560.1 hypothetical protein [Rossellomorea vietnamensis]WQI94642.1 hypothetical protein Q7C14_16490 [Rossellomorea vietnamensis]
MGEQPKGRVASLSTKDEKKVITWIQMKPESNLIFSTKHHGKQRVIYYTHKCITNLDYDKRER